MSLPFHFLDAALAPSPASTDLGRLPEWRLEDLYEGMDSPRFAADLERAEREAKLFAEAYRGKLGELAGRPDAGEPLATAVRKYQSMQDLTGRVIAYASLLYASDVSDAGRAKFYGDAHERVTALAGDLLFFELELNRIDDKRLEAAMAAPALGHYRPWLEDIRKEKPHQLPDDLERLFLEKSVSGAAAWNRLFDDTMSALRFDFEGESLTLEPLLGKLQDPDETKREAAANALAATLGANLRLFALITSTLAKDKEISDRWRKFADVADSRHLANRVEREVVDALVKAVDRRLSAPLASLLRAQGPLVRQGASRPLGPQRPAAERPAAGLPMGGGSRHRARRLWRVFPADGRYRPAFLRRALDRRAGEAGQGPGRILASDHAVGPSLYSRQLSRQDARRHDARARARSRRPSGAGQHQRRARWRRRR